MVFKNSRLANERPDLSFTNPDGSGWANNRGESFVNPYEREVWEYNVEVAKETAKLGFKTFSSTKFDSLKVLKLLTRI